jgi:hypothetical protein
MGNADHVKFLKEEKDMSRKWDLAAVKQNWL